MAEANKQEIPASKLPGNGCPEQFVISLIQNDLIKPGLMQRYNLEEMDWILLKNKCATLTDPHDLLYEIAQHLGTENTLSVRRALCECVVAVQKAEFAGIIEMINEFIAGPLPKQ